VIVGVVLDPVESPPPEMAILPVADPSPKHQAFAVTFGLKLMVIVLDVVSVPAFCFVV
jgi:hypothetical protein